MKIEPKFERTAFLVIVVLIWGVSFLSRLRLQGTAFGLDYGLFFPDSSHYSFRTLQLLGENDDLAADHVKNWMSSHSQKTKELNPEGLIPSTNPVWYVVKTRVIYSLTSAPFVSAFGLIGMLVIPAISTLMVSLLAILGCKTRKSRIITTIAITILFASFTYPRWMFAAITDSLLVAVFAIVAYQLHVRINDNVFHLLSISVLILISSYTRFCLPIWVSILLVMLFQKRIKMAVVIGIVSVSSSYETIKLLMGGNQSLTPTVDAGTLEKLSLSLRLMRGLKAIVIDIAQLIVLDKLFLILIGVSIVLCLKNYKNQSSQLFVATLMGSTLITFAIGEVGTNFRYSLCSIPFMLMALQDLSTTNKEVRKGL